MSVELDKVGEKRLTSKQQKVINMLIYSTKNQSDIAKAIQVSENTLSKWLNKDEFFISEYDKKFEKAQAYRQRKCKEM